MMVKSIAKLVAIITYPINKVSKSIRLELNEINKSKDIKKSTVYISKNIDVPPVNKYGSILSDLNK